MLLYIATLLFQSEIKSHLQIALIPDGGEVSRGMSMDLPEHVLAQLNRETYLKLERTAWVAFPYNGEGEATAIPIYCPSLRAFDLKVRVKVALT
eukprot:SAG11_NODE_174_length_13505_cov_9.126585_10_plen_94_part_00